MKQIIPFEKPQEETRHIQTNGALRKAPNDPEELQEAAKAAGLEPSAVCLGRLGQLTELGEGRPGGAGR